jgi:hypothetical protein
MEQLRNHIKLGEVYRRSDLACFSTAIDRHLATLTKEGILVKLLQGLYYSPKHSKFGITPPDDIALVTCFLKTKEFLLTSPNLYNALGLGLTQLYNTTWVYNHRRSGEFIINGKSFIFKNKPAFPKIITKEYLLIDFLNNLDELAEEQATIIQKLEKVINVYNINELNVMTHKYGSAKTKKIINSMINKTLKHNA